MITAKIEALKVCRIEQGWNCADLARECGTTGTTVTRIEKGASTTPATAKRMADALKKPITDLFSIE